ncbi:MAG: hypothetical protein KGS49_01970 [Planctomycetes bacterium]|nr:hypothetical protein [Planctomycetota bacterium]
MAKCDQGYLCRICKQEVEKLSESELYLRFVIGEIDPETLHLSSECHLDCNPVLAQFIDDHRYASQSQVPEGFRIEDLDPQYVTQRKQLVTRGFQRLLEIQANRKAFSQVQDYPLEEFKRRWR